MKYTTDPDTGETSTEYNSDIESSVNRHVDRNVRIRFLMEHKNRILASGDYQDLFNLGYEEDEIEEAIRMLLGKEVKKKLGGIFNRLNLRYWCYQGTQLICQIPFLALHKDYRVWDRELEYWVTEFPGMFDSAIYSKVLNVESHYAEGFYYHINFGKGKEIPVSVMLAYLEEKPRGAVLSGIDKNESLLRSHYSGAIVS